MIEIRNQFTGQRIWILGDTVLIGASMEELDLHQADLYEANLLGASLFGSNLRGAQLTRADLEGADLREADLRGADLVGANFRGADLRGADLLDCRCHGLMLQDAIYDLATRWPAELEPRTLGARLEFHPPQH